MTATPDRPSTPETPLYAALGAPQPQPGAQDQTGPHGASDGRTADPALVKLRRQYADVEARRAAMPEQDRLRHEAGDAPMLRIQLLHAVERGKRAEAVAAHAGRDADRLRRDWVAIRDRAEQAEAALARVRGECAAIVAERYGQHDEDDDGMREAVRRVLAALDDQPARSAYPITSHAYEGTGPDRPCVADGYGAVCGGQREDHALDDQPTTEETT